MDNTDKLTINGRVTPAAFATISRVVILLFVILLFVILPILLDKVKDE